ncbi:MAG: hypothetical protein JKY15_07475 [Deltaproteobacteria bacterium]|nr:hypothetical protein [Deltaproteobacteria bacterium]
MKNRVLSMLMVGLFSLSALSSADAEQWWLTGKAQEAQQWAEKHWNSLSAETQNYAKWGSAAVTTISAIVLAKVIVSQGTKGAGAVSGEDDRDDRDASSERGKEDD